MIMKKGLIYVLVIIGLIAGASLTVVLWPKAEVITPPDNIIQDRLPNAPTLDNLPFTSETGIIFLTWQAAPTTIASVYRSNVEFTDKSQAELIGYLDNVIANQYKDTITKNGLYYYAVTVSNTIGESPFSNLVSVTVTIPGSIDIGGIVTIYPPAAPFLNELPYSQTDSIILLSWTADPSLQTRVYRSTMFFSKASEAQLIYNIDQPNIYNSWDMVIPGTYYYAVAIYNLGGDSPISNVVTVNVIPKQPQLTVSPVTSTNGIFYLQWTATPGATSYEVYRASNSEGAVLLASLGNVISYTDTIQSSGEYSYSVAAIGEDFMIGSDGVNVVVNFPVSPNPPNENDVLIYWSNAMPGFTCVLSTVSFSVTSFPTAMAIFMFNGLTAYDVYVTDVPQVITVSMGMNDPSTASADANVLTISATGLCALTYIGPNWLLFTRPD
jgi:fibronectin type 3 domain-containing protein